MAAVVTKMGLATVTVGTVITALKAAFVARCVTTTVVGRGTAGAGWRTGIAVVETAGTGIVATVATKTTTVTTAVAATAAKLAVTRATTAAAKTTRGAGVGHTLLGFHARHHFRLELLAAVGFDVGNAATVAELGESHGNTVTSCTAGTANAVGVILGLHGQAEVEYVGHGGHVNAARSHIGCHQDLHLALAQGHQTAVAQALAQGTVQRHSAEAVLLQVVGQAITFNLGARKHDGLVDGGVAQPVVQQLALVGGVVGPEQHLFDVGVFFLRAVDGHTLGFAHHTLGQLLDAWRKRGAEHHGLLAFDGELVHFGEVVGETQVQHAVGFVHYQELDLVELDLHGALQVQQAAWCGHHEISVLQLGDLQLVRHTTHHVGDTQAVAMAHQVNGVMGHLLGQFAGRAQDQRTWRCGLEVAHVGRVLALGLLRRRFTLGNGLGHSGFELGTFTRGDFSLALEQGVQHGQQEGCCFAATGLAGHHQVGKTICAVFTGHGHGNGLGLHHGGFGETHVGHGAHQLGREAQLHKTVGNSGGGVFHDRFRRVCSSGEFRGCRKVSSKGFHRRGIKGLHRREVALHFKSVGHIFLTRKSPPAWPADASLMVKKHQPSNGAW